VKRPQSDTGVSFCNRISAIVWMRDTPKTVCAPEIFDVRQAQELGRDLRIYSASLDCFIALGDHESNATKELLVCVDMVLAPI
jgi:hypothetical protein